MALLEFLFPRLRHTLDRVERSVYRQEIMMSAVTETLLAINDQLNKAANEIVGKIAELESREYITQQDKDILAGIKAGAQTLDDIVPDRVVEEAEAAQEAEVEEPAEEAEEPAEDPKN